MYRLVHRRFARQDIMKSKKNKPTTETDNPSATNSPITELQELYPDKKLERPEQDELTNRLAELRRRVYWWDKMAAWRKKQLLEGAPLQPSETLTEQEANEQAEKFKDSHLIFNGHVFSPGRSPAGIPLRDLEDMRRFDQLRKSKDKKGGGKPTKRYRRLVNLFRKKKPELLRAIVDTKGRTGANLCREVLKEAGKIRVYGDKRDKLNIEICRRAAQHAQKSWV